MKRIFDMMIAFIAGCCMLPVFVLAMFLVRKFIGQPVFFKQLRPGYLGRPFFVYKLRTMTNACDAAGNLLTDEVRLTKLGRFLRCTSIDELPQLWNVLRGDLSLVGPRPLLMKYLDRYTPEQARRHLVKPGITGWAQINGRNAISWEEKFKLDVWYVDNQSFWLDVKILWLTFLKVIRCKDISNSSCATMPEFISEEWDDGKL